MAIHTAISLCSGIGMLDHGINLALGGTVKPVLLVEIEAFAAAHLVSQIEQGFMAPTPIWSDVKTICSREVAGYIRRTGPLGLLYGGIPCQPWSVAGKQRGADDERDLWPYMLEAAERYEPELVFVENVPGIISGRAGDLGGWRIRRDLEKLGYRVEAGLFSSAEVGASHRRQRIFILAYRERRHDDGGGGAGQGRRQEPPDGSSDVALGYRAGLQRADAPEQRRPEDPLAAGRGATVADAEYAGSSPDGFSDNPTPGCHAAIEQYSPNVANCSVEGLPFQSLDAAERGRQEQARSARPGGGVLADGRHDDAPAPEIGGSTGEPVEARRGEQYEADFDAQGGSPLLPAEGIGLPLCAPMRNDYRAWAAVAMLDPSLMPAVERTDGGVADGLAPRVDRLRAVGNGVDPLVVAYAFCTLFARAAGQLK